MLVISKLVFGFCLTPNLKRLMYSLIIYFFQFLSLLLLKNIQTPPHKHDINTYTHTNTLKHSLEKLLKSTQTHNYQNLKFDLLKGEESHPKKPKYHGTGNWSELVSGFFLCDTCFYDMYYYEICNDLKTLYCEFKYVFGVTMI